MTLIHSYNGGENQYKPGQPEPSFEDINTSIWTLAQELQGDCKALLALLRDLERLHRAIREEMFQASLPNTRGELYQLLREIEETGGWPYIERMKLHAFLVHLQPDSLMNQMGEEGPSSRIDSDGNLL